MTEEITPTIDQARNRYARGRLGWYPTPEDLEGGGGWLDREFDRVIRKVQADAFAEGFASCAYWWEIHDFESVATTSNPYLAEYRN